MGEQPLRHCGDIYIMEVFLLKFYVLLALNTSLCLCVKYSLYLSMHHHHLVESIIIHSKRSYSYLVNEYIVIKHRDYILTLIACFA